MIANYESSINNGETYTIWASGPIGDFDEEVNLTSVEKSRVISRLQELQSNGDILDFYVDRYYPEVELYGYDNVMEEIDRQTMGMP